MLIMMSMVMATMMMVRTMDDDVDNDVYGDGDDNGPMDDDVDNDVYGVMLIMMLTTMMSTMVAMQRVSASYTSPNGERQGITPYHDHEKSNSIMS